MQVVDKDAVEKPKGSALFDAVEKAVRSKQRYTMGQIEAIGTAAGARTKLGAAGFVSCACERYGQPAG